MKNLDRLSLMKRQLAEGLNPFVSSALARAYGEPWRLRARFPEKANRVGDLDAHTLLYVIQSEWRDVFNSRLPIAARAAASSAQDGRNAEAHATTDIDDHRTLRALSGAAELLSLAGADTQAATIARLRDDLIDHLSASKRRRLEPPEENGAPAVTPHRPKTPSNSTAVKTSTGNSGGYWVYENWTQKRAIIHHASCSYCKNGEGMHEQKTNRNGQWLGPYSGVAAAQTAADATGQHDVHVCKSCHADPTS